MGSDRWIEAWYDMLLTDVYPSRVRLHIRTIKPMFQVWEGGSLAHSILSSCFQPFSGIDGHSWQHKDERIPLSCCSADRAYPARPIPSEYFAIEYMKSLSFGLVEDCRPDCKSDPQRRLFSYATQCSTSRRFISSTAAVRFHLLSVRTGRKKLTHLACSGLYGVLACQTIAWL